MKKQANAGWMITAGALACLLLAPSPSWGLGVGAYLDAGFGSLEGDYSDVDTSQFGGGFVLDTCVASDKLFNYRFELGYDRASYDLDGGGDVDNDKFGMTHSFGFGLARSEGVRVWLGPQISLYTEENKRSDTVGLGIGPALGANFHVAPTVSLSITWFARVGVFYTDNDDFDNDDGTEWVTGITAAVLFRSSQDRFNDR